MCKMSRFLVTIVSLRDKDNLQTKAKCPFFRAIHLYHVIDACATGRSRCLLRIEHVTLSTIYVIKGIGQLFMSSKALQWRTRAPRLVRQAITAAVRKLGYELRDVKSGTSGCSGAFIGSQDVFAALPTGYEKSAVLPYLFGGTRSLGRSIALRASLSSRIVANLPGMAGTVPEIWALSRRCPGITK